MNSGKQRSNMTMTYLIKITLAVGWRMDGRGIRIDAKIFILQERVNGGLNLG